MAQASMAQVGVQQLVRLLMVNSMADSVRVYVDGLGFMLTNTLIPDGQLR